jgi:hypothetical protein
LLALCLITLLVHKQALLKALAGVRRTPLLPAAESQYAARDLAAYRAHYHGRTPNNSKLSANVKFYRNEGRCQPDKMLVSEFHEQWSKDYGRLEHAHGYIQWLFPIHEHGMNSESQVSLDRVVGGFGCFRYFYIFLLVCLKVLQQHESDTMKTDPVIRANFLASYALILDFYGFELADKFACLFVLFFKKVIF